jgi:hypothetical protein
VKYLGSIKWLTLVEFLLGRVAASLDASTNRYEKCACGADDSKNGCWIFWGFHATALSIQGEGDGREEGDAS